MKLLYRLQSKLEDVNLLGSFAFPSHNGVITNFGDGFDVKVDNITLALKLKIQRF